MSRLMWYPEGENGELTQMFTYDEAAKRFGVKATWLRWHKHRGNLVPDVMAGRTPLFAWNTLSAFIKGRPDAKERRNKVVA